ncbi:BRCA1-associated RING domain protein 1-like [Asterias rubens]|uniref:BRCA1-associated RING domain protein 1-like n=1 Tax=Asterias rubens TaxID=7604 RepID=UPI0014553FFE|nr:BRCA1-associated RING domain protein 1-like [Asterias rubens]
MEVCDWNCTKEALKGLERSLGCGVCNNPLQEPCTLGSCDHLFCRACTKAHLGNSCPICQAPAWVKDLQLKRELASVVTLYGKLHSIINKDPSNEVRDVGMVNEMAGRNDAKVQKVTTEAVLEGQGIPRKALHPRNVLEKETAPSAAGKRKFIKKPSKQVVIGKMRRQHKEQDEIIQENEKNKLLAGSSSSENDTIDPMSVFDFIPSPCQPKPVKKRVRKPNPKALKRKRIAAANRKWQKSHKGGPSKEVRGSGLESSLRHVSFSVETDRSQTSSCPDSSSLESMDITSQDEDQSQLVVKSDGSKTIEEAPGSTQESGYSTGSYKETLSLEGESQPSTRNTDECSSELQNDTPSCDPSSNLDDHCVPVLQHLKENSRRSQRNSKCSSTIPPDDSCARGLKVRIGGRGKTTIKEQTVSRKTPSVIDNSDRLPAGEETSNETTVMTDLSVTGSSVPERRLTRRNNQASSLLIEESNKSANDNPLARQTISRSSRTTSKNIGQKDSAIPPIRKHCPREETGSPSERSVRNNPSAEVADKPQIKSRSIKGDSGKTSSHTPTSRRKVDEGRLLKEAVEGNLGEKGTPSNSEKPSRSSTSPRSGSAVKRNKRGETPLHVAVIKGDVATARLLLQEGADPNSMDNARWTPLHEACNHGHTALVAVLLDNGALINTPGFEHDSPLHDAVMNHRLDVVKLLLKRGASLDVRNMHGLTPVDYAKSEPMRAALKTQPLVNTVTKTTPPMPKTSALSRQRPVVLLGTGLNDSQRKRLQACAKLLGNGRVVSEFGSEVTHLVASCNHDNLCMRTMKYLNAVLSGIWVVSFNWITECLRIKGQAEEVKFEVKGTTTLSNSPGAQRGRQNAEQQLPGLLDGCHFYLQSTFSPPTPSKKEIVQLIKNGAGTLLSRQPKPDDDVIQASTTVPYHARSGSELATCSYFIIHDHVDSRAPPRIRTGKLCTAPICWLMDCISQFELVDLPK